MTKLTMMGHIEDTDRVLQRAIDERNDYGKEFISFWLNNDFKKVIFTGSGTSYNAMRVIRNMWKALQLNQLFLLTQRALIQAAVLEMIKF